MGFGLDSLDIDAAILRKSESDLREFLSALAAKLEAALPGRVQVRRQRDSFLSSKTHVTEIALNTGEALYSISMSGGRVRTSRAKIVRDVTISTAGIAPADWLAEVRGQVAALAGAASDAGENISRLL